MCSGTPSSLVDIFSSLDHIVLAVVASNLPKVFVDCVQRISLYGQWQCDFKSVQPRLLLTATNYAR
jgi:hypothetical protein